MKYHRVYISAGSNVGNKVANCCFGIDALSASGASKVVARSPFYLTEPMGFADQDWFINTAVKVDTVLDPLKLLAALQSIQKQTGRRSRSVRFGPRTLDLDILMYDDQIIQLSQLTIPHPRMHQRRFVLKPICDIDPDIIHPVLRMDMQSLLKGLDNDEQRMIEFRCA